MKKTSLSAIILMIGVVVLNPYKSSAADSTIYCSPDSASNLTVQCEKSTDTIQIKTDADGKNAYYLPNSYDDTTYSHALKFFIDDSVMNGNPDFKNMEIEIEYLDSGYDFFRVTYDSDEGAKVYKDYIETYNTEEIKKATISLDDAVFANGCNGADFKITAPRKRDGTGVYLYGISVKESGTESSVSITSSSDSPGNIFFDGDDRKLNISYKNKRSTALNFDVNYKIIDGDTRIERYSSQKSLSVSEGSTAEDIFEITAVSSYNTYLLCVDVNTSDGKIHDYAEIPFSICVDGSVYGGNPKIGTGAHFNWGRDSETGIFLIRKAGINNIRDGYLWKNFETSEGVYEEEETCTEYLKNAYETNTDVLVAATYGNTIYGMKTSQYMPETDEQRAAYVNYILKILEKNHDRISVIEVWNEPDIASYNPNAYNTPEVYIELLKAVYETVKPLYPDIKIAGPVVSSATLKEAWITDFLTTDIDDDGNYDAYKYFDVVTMHHYAMNSNSYTVKSIVDVLNGITDLFAQYGCEDKEIYHTEFGAHNIVKTYNSSLGHAVMSLENKSAQAKKIAKYYLSLHAAVPGEKYYIYDFSNDDFAENVSGYNYGLTESDEADIPYAAKPSFLAVSNINKLLSGADTAEYSETENPSCAHTDVVHKAYTLTFTDTDKNQKIYAFFTDNETMNYTFSDIGEKTEFFDLYGNKLSYEPVDGIYSFTISEAPVYAKVYYDTVSDVHAFLKDEGVGIKGYACQAEAGDRISIKIFDSTGKLVYIDENSVNSNQEFEFTFIPDDMTDTYTVRLGTRSFETFYELSFAAGELSKAVLKAKSGTNEITNMQEFNEAQVLTLETEIYDSGLNGFDIVMGYYQEGNLLKTEIINSSDMMVSDNGYSTDMSEFSDSAADMVKIYMFDSVNNIVPVVKNITLE